MWFGAWGWGPYTGGMNSLTGERRALSAAILVFYAFMFLLVAFQPPMPGWGACFSGMATVYGLAFFGLVAGYFWARWYSIGLGISGAISAGFSLWQIGPEPALLFYGGSHAAIALMLWGTGMAKIFDGRKEWREKFHLDQAATDRLGKAVVRMAVSLPYMVMYALAPKDDTGSLILGLGALLFAGWGFKNVLRMRSVGLVAYAGSAFLLLGSLVRASASNQTFLWVYGTSALVAATAALALFAKPTIAFLRD